MSKKMFIVLICVVMVAAVLGLVVRNADFSGSQEIASVETDVAVNTSAEEPEETFEIEKSKGYTTIKTEAPELVLSNQLECCENNYYFAELNELINDKYSASIYITTNMPVENVYYTVTDSYGNELYKGEAGLSYGTSGLGGYDIVINKLVFDGDNENGYKLKPSWANETFTFYIQSGKDSSIKVIPNF